MTENIKGTQRSDEARASDTRSTAELVERYLADREDIVSLATLHYRGGAQELQVGLDLLASAIPSERAAGADILAQLGWQDRTFVDESVDALLRALDDFEDEVVRSTLYALGNRRSPRTVDAALRFVDHPSAEMRFAAVHALMPHEMPTVVEALIKLSGDVDPDVRNWAAFTLARQFDADTPALRAALLARLTDEHSEVRGEAVIGLAMRRDLAVLPAIVRELQEEIPGDLIMEAAELLADSQLLPSLHALGERLSSEQNDDLRYLREWVADVIAATSSPSASPPPRQRP